jgi:alpha-glucosidase
MKKLQMILLTAFITIPAISQQYSLSSPDNTIKVEIGTGDQINFRVLLDNKEIISPSVIAVEIDKITAGWKVKDVTKRNVDEMIRPVVPEKFAGIRDNFNEFTIRFRNQLALTFRAYNNGMAYRWESIITDSIKVLSETALMGFQPDDKTWYPLEKSFYSHNERLYKQYPIKQIGKDSLASLPALVNHSGVSILISEADLFDYPGMWLTGDGNNKLTAVFPKYPLEEKASGDRDVRITATENYIARTNGFRTFPWRTFIIARKDADLITNTLIYQLSQGAIEDYSWVKPGKVAWDWWNALNIEGVDFNSGVNTETYKYYIDFAAKYGLEYIILDEGWSPTTDITKTVADINMSELLAYAHEKNVGVILWVLWTSLNRQMEQALNLYKEWGIKGIKVDFMQRDDQRMVNFYERTAKEAAKRKLLVDFHGAYKPTGLERKYPNVITREGVYGLEQSKWDKTKSISPEHNVTLPFIRNALGAMDYTPGAMLNAQKNSWSPIYLRPMSLGTRCHQLAMYVVYTSPLQMLADAPSNYYHEPDCMDFLSQVPVIWNETRVLDAKTGDYLLIARKSMKGEWYIGAMTDWTARDMEVDFSFLEEGNYTVELWQDGVNANKNANDFAKKTITLKRGTKQTIHLAPGGGFVIRIRPGGQ